MRNGGGEDEDLAQRVMDDGFDDFAPGFSGKDNIYVEDPAEESGKIVSQLVKNNLFAIKLDEVSLDVGVVRKFVPHNVLCLEVEKVRGKARGGVEAGDMLVYAFDSVAVSESGQVVTSAERNVWKIEGRLGGGEKGGVGVIFRPFGFEDVSSFFGLNKREKKRAMEECVKRWKF